MTQTYDITLKSLLKKVPRVFLKILTGYESGEFIDTEFPAVTARRPDLLNGLPVKSIFHPESLRVVFPAACGVSSFRA